MGEVESIYGSEAYAAALAEFGTPRWLPHSQGWVLIRSIGDRDGGESGPWRDATSCYPLFVCRRWDKLDADLIELRAEGLVSLTLVADPWGDHCPATLTRCFAKVARPFKPHFVADLEIDPQLAVSAHHRRNARRFLRHARVEICPRPAAHLDDWCRLYKHLVRRHHIRGMARFSQESFARQLDLPGAVLLRAATDDGTLAGLQLWLADGPLARHHLSAYGPDGYRWGGASYGLLWRALAHFRRAGLRWASLGSGAGLAHDPADGLTRFKQGWATNIRWSWLCGAILDESRYRQLSRGRDGVGEFFPVYRAPRLSHLSQVKERAHAG